MSRFVTFITEWPKRRGRNKSDRRDVIARNAGDTSPPSHRIIILIITHRLLHQPAQFWIPFSTPAPPFPRWSWLFLTIAAALYLLDKSKKRWKTRRVTSRGGAPHNVTWKVDVFFFPPSNDEVSDAFQRYSLTTLNSAAFLGPTQLGSLLGSLTAYYWLLLQLYDCTLWLWSFLTYTKAQTPNNSIDGCRGWYTKLQYSRVIWRFLEPTRNRQCFGGQHWFTARECWPDFWLKSFWMQLLQLLKVSNC